MNGTQPAAKPQAGFGRYFIVMLLMWSALVGGLFAAHVAQPSSDTRADAATVGRQGYSAENVDGIRAAHYIGGGASRPETDVSDRALNKLLAAGISYGVVFLFGVMGIVVGARKITRDEAERDRAVGELRQINERLIAGMKDRTAELAKLNDELLAEVSDRETAEQALRESEAQYRRLVENAPLGIASFTINGKLKDANPSFLLTFDLCAIDACGVVYPEGLPIFGDPGFRRKFDWCIASRNSGSVELSFISRAAGQRDVRVHLTPMRDKDDSVVGVQAILDDITERKRARKAVRDSEERMRRVIESSPVGIGIVQRAHYQYVNPAFVEIFGYARADELIGQYTGVTCGREDRRMLARMTEDLLQGKPVPQFCEFVGVRRDDSQFEAGLWLAGIEHQGEPAVLAFVTDVSERRKLRAQLLQAQKLDAVGTLAGGIAHDFNNLLQAIHGYAELALLKTSEAQPGRAEFIEIKQAAVRAGELTQGLLTFSRQVPGKLRPVDVNREIVEVMKLLSRTIPKMIKTEVSLANDIRTVGADPVQLHQAVINLVLNARDAMPDGGTLLIETKNVELDDRQCKALPGCKPGEYVRLLISDTGCGMDCATRDRIFEPFFSTKERGSGTGLGLSIVYGIVKSHGGSINCYSEPGQGTTFRIYLPGIKSEPSVREAQQNQALPVGNETILLVDDEALLRNLASEILTRLGYTVITAAGGPEAMALYETEKERIDLVILDLIMPELSGRECLKRIRNIDPLQKVIIVSGYASNGDAQEFAKEGARGFVRKPYETKMLLQAVRDVLDDCVL